MTTPAQSINNALAAYARTAKTGPGLDARDAQGGDDFASLVKGAIEEAKKIGERSEQLSMAAAHDRADIDQVVTAVAEAEATLQTVVAIRDKVLEAYKDIIRMPI